MAQETSSLTSLEPLLVFDVLRVVRRKEEEVTARDYQGFWVGYSRVRVWVSNLDPHQTPTPIRGWWVTQGFVEMDLGFLFILNWYYFHQLRCPGRPGRLLQV